MRRIIEEIRLGKCDVPDGAARTIAEHRDAEGKLLDLKTAGVGLINVLRPSVANAHYVVFSAMALHQQPDCCAALQGADEDELQRFSCEVRHYYPFIPFIAAGQPPGPASFAREGAFRKPSPGPGILPLRFLIAYRHRLELQFGI
jgi:hypothetical protein